MPVRAVFGEFSGDTPHARCVRTRDSAANCESGRPPYGANRIEQRREVRREPQAVPIRHRVLELDVALRRLHVLEQSVDDLVDVDTLCLGGKVRQHAVPENGPRNPHDVGG